ncbi:type II secretion system protein [Halochromatium glycolicum]|uniref:type IV pilus modification PilV family protein n=1 Tax=Halochromatium glycolicum TaxID=85075 RepID=UPI0030B85721
MLHVRSRPGLGSATRLTLRPSGHGYRRRGGERGFSLLEVLVAFAILALSLGVLLQIFSRALNTTALNETYSRAVALAEAKLDRVGIAIPLEEGVYSGEPEDGMDWIISIEPYQPGGWLGDAAAFASYQVTAVAAWPSASGTRRVTLRTIRLGPESGL